MKFLMDLWKLLMSETGEAGDSTEEQVQDETVDQVTTQDEPEVTDAFEQAKVSGQSQTQNTEEQFIDPKDLPEELKPHWKRMHREYNKRLQGIKEHQNKAEAYDRFYNDPQFAEQTLQAWAKQNGLVITRNGEVKQDPQQAGPQAKAPAALVEQFKRNLSPELQWMAESQADAFWAAQQMLMQPLAQKQQEAVMTQRNQEYDELASELAEVAPEWVDKEEEMLGLLEFLTGQEMKHKTYGSKLQILYNIVTGNAAAVKTATQRMVQGVKNRTANGNRVTNSTPNLAERIKKANKNDAWELAKQAALNGE